MTKKNKKSKNNQISNDQVKEIGLSEKDRATASHQPWVSVIKTHINPDNVRNGFFELDWNDYFIAQLKQAGYGTDGDSNESIVDRWFRDLAKSMLAEEGLDIDRAAGYIDVSKI